MARRPEFQPWIPFADHSRLTSGVASDSAYQKATGKLLVALMRAASYDGASISQQTQDFVCQSILQLVSELNWHRLGRPYYKVWPGIAESLSRTKMRFDSDYFHTPFPCFAIMLPCGMFPADTFLAMVKYPYAELIREVRRLLPPAGVHSSPGSLGEFDAAADTAEQEGDERLLLSWYENGNPGSGHCTISLQLPREHSVEEALQGAFEDSYQDYAGEFPREKFDKAAQDRFLRIAVGVSMFAVDQHELVLPDIRRDVLEKRFPKRRGKLGAQLQQQEIDRAIANNKGWVIGSEIDLPRPHVVTSGERPPDKGNELQYGYMRSAYMRMQPYGEGRKQRRLQFIAAHPVRPDLPFRTTRGFRLRDSS